MILGNFLSDLMGKTVTKVYQVDYTHDRHEDIYLPWLFSFTFEDFDKVLEIEGDIDSEHIDVCFKDLNTLQDRLQQHDLRNESKVWRSYEVTSEEILEKCINQKITKVEYAVDKPVFVINGTPIKGKQDVFTALRLYFDTSFITVFDSGLGLLVTETANIGPEFTETYNWYELT